MQHPISSFQSLEIRSLQYRKQGPTLPTLVINLKPDAEYEKQRKRRSSRTGGLTSSKDPYANQLLFRTIPEERFNIYDWQIAIQPLLTSNEYDDALSPISPPFTSFTNPFASNPFNSRDTQSSSSLNQKPEFKRRPSNQTTTSSNHAPKVDRPSALISPSPSLRSRRSDLSSQASLQPPMGHTSSHPQGFTPGLPPDLPSPASTSGYDTQFIEGWTSAQGRSSALSSHTRASNSIASVASPNISATAIASSPPGPRETILDRAFMMKYIPGSERVHDKDEENISSIARFEALMREVDKRKELRNARQTSISQNRHGRGLRDESEESEMGDEERLVEDIDIADGLELDEEEVVIPTPAQRALDYISGRRAPLPSSPSREYPVSSSSRSPPIPFLNQQAMSALQGNGPAEGGLRPPTGKRRTRPHSISAATMPSLLSMNNSTGGMLAVQESEPKGKEKRRSSTSIKRLSFTEFTKRLSSTSSLLLVQTNASSSSGSHNSKRESSEIGYGSFDGDEVMKGGLRNSSGMAMGIRGGAGPSGNDREMRDKRCGWRGSVGVFGGEGGFL